MRSKIIPIVSACSNQKKEIDELVMCHINNEIIISEIEKFIEETNDSRGLKFSEVVLLEIFRNDDLEFTDSTVSSLALLTKGQKQVSIRYCDFGLLDYRNNQVLIPCQKIAGHRVVLSRNYHTLDYGTSVVSDTLQRFKLANENYKSLEEFDSLATNYYKFNNDLEYIRENSKSNYYHIELLFVLENNKIIDNSYQLTKVKL